MPTSSDASARYVLAACLFLSGAAALIYEIVWLRQLGLVMGQTVYALSTVLTAFLGGLALGAYLAARWTRRHAVSFRLYAAIEVAIAASALAMPWLIGGLDPVFGAAYRTLADQFVTYNLVQFVLCAAVLLLPTVLMGTTLPLVTALLLRNDRQVAVGAGVLYALNSLGGVAGAAAAGFVLLPALGMLRTGLVAAGLNGLAAAGALVLGTGRVHTGPASALGDSAPTADDLEAVLQERSEQAPFETPPEEGGSSGRAVGSLSSKGMIPAHAEEAPSSQGPSRSVRARRTTSSAMPPSAWPSPSLSILALLYGLSGFAALTLEVAWARVVSLSIGSTTYGFTITLVSYITGLAVGSIIVPRLRWLARYPVRAVFLLHCVIALWSLVSLPYLGSLPVRVMVLNGTQGLTFERLMAGELLLVLLTIAVPTLAMGGMFPLITQLLHRGAVSSGYATGISYAANTLGNIAGSWVGGFILVPLVGMRGTIVASAVLSGAVGLLYLLPRLRLQPARSLTYAALVASALAAAVMWAPAWNRELITSAPFLPGRPNVQPDLNLITLGLRMTTGDLVDYREGASGVVTVKRASTGMALFLDGLQESASGSQPLRLLAHLPLLLHGKAQRVLVVGLGGGHTLGGVLAHPVESVDCIEISPEVRDVTQRYFARDALADPRVRLLIGDGRNHLRHSRTLYDVIISQPSHAWTAGGSNLFTREYFREVRDRLAPGGIACSWFHTYSEEGRQSIMRAWAEVFPSAYLFDTTGAANLLIGLKDDRPLSAANVAAALSNPVVARELQQFGISSPADVFGALLAGSATLRRLTDGTPANTDDNGFVALRSWRDALKPSSLPVRPNDDPLPLVDATFASPADTEAFTTQLRARYEERQQAGGAPHLSGVVLNKPASQVDRMGPSPAPSPTSNVGEGH